MDEQTTTPATVSADSTEATVPASQVRAWARENGIAVGTRGALSRELVAKYTEAHAA